MYNPVRGELFRAVKGGGAFLNDRPISVSSAKTLSEAVIATNVGYDRSEEGIQFMTRYNNTYHCPIDCCVQQHPVVAA